MVWLDLEMSGLDPEKERIIEIATVITDWDLNVIAEGPDLVIHQPDAVLNAMDDWNKKQHVKSGLVEAVKSSEISNEEAEIRTLDFIKQHCHPKQSPLCGNSVHHDRRFLIKYMPQLNEYLHYRHVDVTTVKALVHRWYKKPKAFPKKRETHRALADIIESIEELRYLRENFFIRENP